MSFLDDYYDDEYSIEEDDIARIVLTMEDGSEEEITQFDPLSETLSSRVLSLYSTEFREGFVDYVSTYYANGDLIETVPAAKFTMQDMGAVL